MLFGFRSTVGLKVQGQRLRHRDQMNNKKMGSTKSRNEPSNQETGGKSRGFKRGSRKSVAEPDR